MGHLPRGTCFESTDLLCDLTELIIVHADLVCDQTDLVIVHTEMVCDQTDLSSDQTDLVVFHADLVKACMAFIGMATESTSQVQCI